MSDKDKEEFERELASAPTATEEEADFNAAGGGGSDGGVAEAVAAFRAEDAAARAGASSPSEPFAAGLAGLVQAGTGGLFRKGQAAAESLLTGEPYADSLEATEKAMGGLADRNWKSDVAGQVVGEGLMLGSSWTKGMKAAKAATEAQKALQLLRKTGGSVAPEATKGLARVAEIVKHSDAGKMAALAGGRAAVDNKGDLPAKAQAAIIAGTMAGGVGAGAKFMKTLARKFLAPTVTRGESTFTAARHAILDAPDPDLPMIEKVGETIIKDTPLTRGLAWTGSNAVLPALGAAALAPVIGPVAAGVAAMAGTGAMAGGGKLLRKLGQSAVQDTQGPVYRALKKGIGAVPYYLEKHSGDITTLAGGGVTQASERAVASRDRAKALYAQAAAQKVQARAEENPVAGAAEHQKQMATNPAYREAVKEE